MGFVARLAPDLTVLRQATGVGLAGARGGAQSLAIHPTSGDVYVSGSFHSYGIPFSGFVTRLNASLTTLFKTTYLNGDGRALAISPSSGEVYVTGLAIGPLPGTAGGAQETFGGGPFDSFVMRLNASLTNVDQATYLGGNGWDEAWDLAIEPTSGEVYVAGETSSDDFPGTAGGAQANFAGDPSVGVHNAFIARLAGDLTTINQSTYLGGSSGARAFALAINPSDAVFVAGETSFPRFPGNDRRSAAGIWRRR